MVIMHQRKSSVRWLRVFVKLNTPPDLFGSGPTNICSMMPLKKIAVVSGKITLTLLFMQCVIPGFQFLSLFDLQCERPSSQSKFQLSPSKFQSAWLESVSSCSCFEELETWKSSIFGSSARQVSLIQTRSL